MRLEFKKATSVVWRSKFWRIVAECLCGIAAVALATFICFQLQLHLPTPSCSYFLIIVLLSSRGSLVSSIIVSLIAVGCLDYYFLPPVFTLSIGDPRDIAAGITFITTAAVISGLVSRVRALMAEKLQKSQTYLSEAQQLSHTGSFGWNVATGVITWSEETFRIFQYEPILTPTVESILQRVHPEDATYVKQTIEHVSREGTEFNIEHRLLMPDGAIKYLHIVAKPIKTKMRVLEFVGAVRDITEHKKAEVTLNKSTAVMEFVGAVMDITERKKATITERNRVAQELHDTLLQGFTGMGLKLDAIANGLPPSLAATKEQLQKILEQSDEYLTEARRSVWNLRSTSLDLPGNFPEVLKKASERVLQDTGIPLRFTTGGATYKLAPEIEDNFLRICQEAVTNAVKHAKPAEVEVMLEYNVKELRLRVHDNGRGFDPDGADGSKDGHFGLAGIRERTKRLGGNLSLKSRRGLGTEILVTVHPSPKS